MMNPLNDSDLECLIFWPRGSAGWHNDLALLRLLNVLCRERGYGAVPQFAAWIEELWRNPESRAKFEKQQRETVAALLEAYPEAKGNGENA